MAGFVRFLLALGVSTAPAATTQAAFFTLDNPPPELPRNVEAATGSVARLRAKNDIGGGCSGTVISNSGHVLLALHCLEECLEQSGLLSHLTGPGLHLRVTKSQVPTLTCSDYLIDRPGVFKGGARIIWLGRGFGTIKNEHIDQVSTDEFAALRAGIDDYAILQYEDYPAGHSCLAMSGVDVAAGEPLWLLGFPHATSRGDSFDSVGRRRMHFSYGRVRASIRQDPYLASVLTNESQWRRQEELTGERRFYITDLDMMPGASGGAVLNAAGQLAGVMYGVVKSSAERYLGASTFAIRSTYIRDEVQKALGEKADAVFRCD